MWVREQKKEKKRKNVFLVKPPRSVVTRPLVLVYVWDQEKKELVKKGKKINRVTCIHLEAPVTGPVVNSFASASSSMHHLTRAVPQHSLPVVVELRLAARLCLVLSLPEWLLLLPRRHQGCARPRGGWADLAGRPSSLARGRPLLPQFRPVSPHFFPVLKPMDASTASSRGRPALRFLCPKISLLSVPSHSLLRWLVGAPRVLPSFTVAVRLTTTTPPLISLGKQASLTNPFSQPLMIPLHSICVYGQSSTKAAPWLREAIVIPSRSPQSLNSTCWLSPSGAVEPQPHDRRLDARPPATLRDIQSGCTTVHCPAWPSFHTGDLGPGCVVPDLDLGCDVRLCPSPCAAKLPHQGTTTRWPASAPAHHHACTDCWVIWISDRLGIPEP
jgi:hypothetical protein